MGTIISKLYELIHQTANLIELEESVRLLMYEVFASQMGEAFTRLNDVIVKEKQAIGWIVERNDSREVVQFTFGFVGFTHTLMHDEQGIPHYCIW